jgi:hypothetical protein
MLAEQKSESLSGLAEEDAEADESFTEGGLAEADREEMAAYVNSRTTLIAILGILLLLSVASNAMLLAVR